MPKLIVGRHTETIFNQQNIFTGCMDVPLSAKGIAQANSMINSIYTENIDVVFTSGLQRAKETAAILMQAYYEKRHDKYPVFGENRRYCTDKYIPILSDERLNERSYGILEGLNKKEVELKYGKQQVFLWRRGWSESPKSGESLQDVCVRVHSCLNDVIIPLLKERNNVLIICHQNSMRAIKIILENINSADAAYIEFANGEFMYFYYDDGQLHLLR